MNTIALGRNKSIHLLLVLSLICSFFVMPMPAKAGILSSVWTALKPVTHIAGRVGGAIMGATMASAIVPPLGTLAGGIVGWLVGGVITDYATASLTNLAVVGAGAAGALALGPGALGVVGGFLLGGVLGKIAIGLLYKADKYVTGGVLFNKAQATSVGGNYQPPAPVADQAAPAIPVSPSSVRNVFNSTTDKVNDKLETVSDTVKDKLETANEKVKKAKDNLVREAQEKYEKASKAYREAAEKAENSAIVVKAKEAMELAKRALQQLLRK